jgi:hypothetical protein
MQTTNADTAVHDEPAKVGLHSHHQAKAEKHEHALEKEHGGEDSTTVLREHALHSYSLHQARAFWNGDHKADKTGAGDGALTINNIWAQGDGQDTHKAHTHAARHDVNLHTNPNGDTTRGSADISSKDGVVTADGKTAHGQKVHAEVSGTHARALLEGGATVEIDKKNHVSDLHSGQWTIHNEHGKGTVTNNESGQSLTKQGDETKIHDRDGRELVTDSRHGLKVNLHGLAVRVAKAAADSEQSMNDNDSADKDKVKAFRKTDGNWSVKDGDVTINTNKHGDHTDIEDKDGNIIRVRHEHGKNIVSAIDHHGDERQLTQQQLQNLQTKDNLQVDAAKGTVTLNDRQIVDGNGNVKPTADSRIDVKTGLLHGVDDNNQTLEVGSSQTNKPIVKGNGFIWTNDSGFVMQGNDGSIVSTTGQAAILRDGSGNTTSLGWDGLSTTMTDSYGSMIFHSSFDGFTDFWDGTDLSAEGELFNTYDGINDWLYDYTDSDGILIQDDESFSASKEDLEEAEREDAHDDAAEASVHADAAIAIATAAIAGVVMPENDAMLAGSEATLNQAFNSCIAAGDYNAAAMCASKIGELQTARALLAPMVDQSRLMLQAGISSPFLIKEAQNMGAGFTSEGAVDKVLGEVA